MLNPNGTCSTDPPGGWLVGSWQLAVGCSPLGEVDPAEGSRALVLSYGSTLYPGQHRHAPLCPFVQLRLEQMQKGKGPFELSEEEKKLAQVRMGGMGFIPD